MPGIVDDDVEAAGVLEDVGVAGLGRCVGLDVEFDGAQVETVIRRLLGNFGDTRGVAAFGFAPRGVDGVTGFCERFGGHEAEAGGSAGDEDELLGHGTNPSMQ
jgi:hypothetical protein